MNRTTVFSAAAALVPLLWAAVGPVPPLLAQDDSGAASNRGCFDCHAAEDEVMEFADGTEVSITIDEQAYLASPHGKLECTTCHVGLDVMEHMSLDRETHGEYRQKLAQRCASCHAGTATDVDAAFLPKKIVDGFLHSSDADGAPLCHDCHAPHAGQRGDAIPTAASKSCAGCHEEVFATYQASVHGAGLATVGDADLPTCTYCHTGHLEPGRAITERNVRLGRPCMGCHGDREMMDRHGLSTDVVSTYLNDFHGVSVGFYDAAGGRATLPTLVCADCHGVHDVMSMSAANPLLMKSNLRKICQECHADASESFPDAWLSHYEPSLERAPLVFAVKLGYWIFIPFVIVGLALQIFAHLVLFPRRKTTAHAAGAPRIEPGDDRRLVTRFSGRQRLEHLFVMLTFVLLLLTGLPQKFWDAGWAMWLTALFGGIDSMRTVHRATGIVFTALCVVHAAIAIHQVISRRTTMSIVPTKKDFSDAIVNLKFYVGAADAPPKFDRYDYRQKFEYWGMIVGSLVMVLSGFVLYFPMLFAEYLPGQLIPAAKMAHTYEAMMALLTIVVWHMYGAHLNPDCFPLDRSIFTGRISLARMKHEHAIEYERERGRLDPEPTVDAITRAKRADTDSTSSAPCSA